MGTVQEGAPVVLLSDGDGATSLAGRLSPESGSVPCYSSVAELVKGQPLSTIDVLVVRTRRSPRGVVLAALGRMSLEYPGMQKLAVMDEPPPLPVAEYLTSCGVDLVWSGTGEDREREVVSIVERMRARKAWLGDVVPAHSAA